MNRIHTVRLAVIAGALATVILTPFAAGPSAAGDAPPDKVAAWIDDQAKPLRSIEPLDPFHDLRPVRGITAGASVVGLGESTHGSHELFQVKHRIVRFLVEELGVRTIALEDDFGSGALLDRYVTTGDGDPRQLAQRMSSPFWAAQETVALLEWARAYNETHEDDVRILGTDLLSLRQTSFDHLTAHVEAVAPDRLDELTALLEPVRIRTTESEQFGWYFQLTDAERQGLIAAAQRIEPFIDGLTDAADVLDREYAKQHARVIAGWYENYAETTGFRAVRERFIADSIGWWQQLVGGRTVYWAANAHTAAADQLTYRAPGLSQTGTMAGGLLENRLGKAYVSIGTWFHHGTISSDYEAPSSHRVGPPAEELLEGTLGRAEPEAYLLDLPDRGAPRLVKNWLAEPSTMRVILPSYAEPDDSSDYNMTVPSLEHSFDAFVFIRETTATQLLE